MKKKLIIISAVAIIIFSGTSAFSQNAVPVNTSSTANKTTVHHIKPVTAKEIPSNQSSARNTVKFVHPRVQPLSASKQSPTPTPSATAATNPVHMRVKPVSENNNPTPVH